MTESWADRAAAGRELAAALTRVSPRLVEPLVLGLARGGVEVAAPVAAALADHGATLDVLVVRKIARPQRPELGLGAVAEDGPVVWDESGLSREGLTPDDLAGVVRDERAECGRRVAAYRGGAAAPALSGRTVVVVDDGIATGVTARAAVRAVHSGGAARVVLAAPVLAAAAAPLLDAEGAQVVALLTPRRLLAVSRWYADFRQTPDARVIALLTATGLRRA